jgi:hypothetical protein
MAVLGVGAVFLREGKTEATPAVPQVPDASAPAPARAPTGTADSTPSPVSVAVAATVPADTASTPSVAPLTMVDSGAGVPVELKFAGVLARRRLTSGDSVRVQVYAVDRQGRRVDSVRVQWTSSDTARLVRHGSFAVARGPGGPVTLTARSGRLETPLRLVVRPPPTRTSDTAAATAMPPGPRPDVAPPAAPSHDAVRAAVDSFVAALRARPGDELERLASAPDAAASVPNLAKWLRGADGLRAEVVGPVEPAVVAGGQATSEFAVRLRKRATLGLRHVEQRARFRIAFVREGAGWRAERVQLLELLKG